MAINNRQFALLNAMGIDLWTSKNNSQCEAQIDNKTIQNEPCQKTQVTFNLDHLNQQPLFNDILLAMNLTKNDISDENNQLKLKQFSWQFSSDETITYQQQTLCTPSIEVLAKSPQLKLQLWQTMMKEKLTCH